MMHSIFFVLVLEMNFFFVVVVTIFTYNFKYIKCNKQDNEKDRSNYEAHNITKL